MIIKVCGMREAANIFAVEQTGPDMMGFIFYPPSPRYVADTPEYLPERAKRVGVFVDADEAFIMERVERFRLDAIQLHGHETPATCQRIKAQTGLQVFKALKITPDFNFDVTEAFCGVTDMFVFDTPTSAMGGSGRTWDHSLLDRYKGTTPFLVSGGLAPEQVTHLAALQHPCLAGLDLNSRFETSPAVKDIAALYDFITTFRKLRSQQSSTNP